MNCTDFERLLEQYQAGTLPEAERLKTEEHVSRCAACRSLLEVLQSGEEQVGSFDLSRIVLSRTTGPACGKCKSLLGDFLDGVLDGIEGELIMSHLRSCVSCDSVFRTMCEMAEVLPRMQEMTPDSSFVPDVLRSFRILRRDEPGSSRILDFFRGLAQRPRFSWEAAYLGALLILGLFGTPFSPAHEAGSRLLASLQDSDGLIAQADSSIERWRQEAQISIAAAGRAGETIGRMKTRSIETVEALIGDGQDFLRESEGHLVSAGKATQAKIAEVYHGLKVRPKR